MSDEWPAISGYVKAHRPDDRRLPVMPDYELARLLIAAQNEWAMRQHRRPDLMATVMERAQRDVEMNK